MTRRKPKAPAVVITSDQEVDEVLREMAECDREIERIQSTMNAAIDAVKTNAKDRAIPHMLRRKELEESLAAYATYHKQKLFAKGKTITRVFGRFGFRRSTVLKPMSKRTWATVLEEVKSFGLTTAVRVKEEINKEVLQEWPDERLERVGARRLISDKFWVEVDQTALEDATNGGR